MAPQNNEANHLPILVRYESQSMELFTRFLNVVLVYAQDEINKATINPTYN